MLVSNKFIYNKYIGGIYILHTAKHIKYTYSYECCFFTCFLELK